MPTTDNYTTTAASYKNLFQGQGRTNAPAAVNANEQYDRDNLLHFIEDKFKSNVKGGFSLINLRAFLHTLVKSIRNQADDKSYVVIGNRGGRVSTGDAGRFYYGSSGSGYNTFSSYTSNELSLSAQDSFNAISAPFEFFNVACKGTIQNGTDRGDVTIKLCYSDQDNGVDADVQNLTQIGSTTVDCAITDTGYDYSISSVVKVPAGKLIWLLIENTGHTSGTEYLYFTNCLYATTHSTNWTSS